MNPGFVHLNLHSEFSLVDGILRIGPLIERARALGMPAVAVTDRANLFCMVRFYRAAVAGGIKPIIGVDSAARKGVERHPGRCADVARDGPFGIPRAHPAADPVLHGRARHRASRCRPRLGGGVLGRDHRHLARPRRRHRPGTPARAGRRGGATRRKLGVRLPGAILPRRPAHQPHRRRTMPRLRPSIWRWRRSFPSSPATTSGLSSAVISRRTKRGSVSTRAGSSPIHGVRGTTAKSST